MKRTGRLYSEVLYWDNLLAAFYKAAKTKRRSPAVRSYEKNLYGNLKGL